MSTYQEAKEALIKQEKGSKLGDIHLCYVAPDKTKVYAFEYGCKARELTSDEQSSDKWVIEI